MVLCVSYSRRAWASQPQWTTMLTSQRSVKAGSALQRRQGTLSLWRSAAAWALASCSTAAPTTAEDGRLGGSGTCSCLAYRRRPWSRGNRERLKVSWGERELKINGMLYGALIAHLSPGI